MMMDSNTQCVILVLLEMGLSFSGIVCNLLIVTTLRHDESLKGSTLNFLLLNLCFSNLLISFLVKPISAIYVGYAISTGEWQVGLAFCTLYTFTYRTTWCVFPFTLVAMCWCKLLAQCKCGFCNLVLCCWRDCAAGSAVEQTDSKDLTAAEMAFLGVTEGQGGTAGGGADSSVPQQSTFTELAMQYGSGGIRHGGSLLFQTSYDTTRDSLSTPTPSTATDNCNQITVAGNASNNPVPNINSGDSNKNNNEGNNNNDDLNVAADGGNGSGGATRKFKRTIEDGPTARQKVLVAFIWLGSAFFGVTTCFPDKVFGLEMSQKILEDQLRTIAPSAGTPRDMDLTYCTVKTGVNDLLDYIALMVAFVLPLVIGPCAVAVFQGLFAVLSRFLCGPSTHVLSLESAAAIAAGPGGAAISSAAAANAANAANAATDAKTAFKSLALRRPDLSKGPGWPIIVGFTLAFAATYPVHMYVAEVYVTENFSFLLVKYCVGFLFVLFVPLITLVLEEEIRYGIRAVFGSAVLCLQEIDTEEQQQNNDQVQRSNNA